MLNKKADVNIECVAAKVWSGCFFLTEIGARARRNECGGLGGSVQVVVVR